MRSILAAAAILILGISSGYGYGGESQAQPDRGFRRISKETLRSKLGQPDLVILDVRFNNQWRVSENKLPGALHEDPEEVASWSHKYSKNTTTILY
jgi:hypothetical protein